MEHLVNFYLWFCFGYATTDLVIRLIDWIKIKRDLRDLKARAQREAEAWERIQKEAWRRDLPED